MADWSNELVLEFLDLYQAEPTIYDPKHPAHKNKKKMNDAWLRIKRALSVNVPVVQIKKKKDSLMAAFRHHLRKKKASIKSGANSDDVYTPSWYAYEIMEDFLGPLYEVYDCDPTLFKTEDSELFDEHEEDIKVQDENSNNCDALPQPMPTPHFPTSSMLTRQHHSRRPPELQHANQQMDQAFAILQDLSQEDDDECELYGKLIAKKLRKMPETEREQLMYDIDGLFLKANKRFKSLIYTDHSSSSRASSTCVLSPLEVLIQDIVPTSVITSASNIISVPLTFHDNCIPDQ